jgi:hypothetical protein
MMTVFRDKQVRLAMLLLYGLAALCLSLAQAEQIFAEPSLDRPSYCLSASQGATGDGLSGCVLCGDLAFAQPAFAGRQATVRTLATLARWADALAVCLGGGLRSTLGPRAPPVGS